MKKLKYLLLAMALTGCKGYILNGGCPSKTYKNLKFGDRVKVTYGFYAGASGTVLNRWEVYRENECNVAGFRVKLIRNNSITEVAIEQEYLELTE